MDRPPRTSTAKRSTPRNPRIAPVPGLFKICWLMTSRVPSNFDGMGTDPQMDRRHLPDRRRHHHRTRRGFPTGHPRKGRHLAPYQEMDPQNSGAASPVGPRSSRQSEAPPRNSRLGPNVRPCRSPLVRGCQHRRTDRPSRARHTEPPNQDPRRGVPESLARFSSAVSMACFHTVWDTIRMMTRVSALISSGWARRCDTWGDCFLDELDRLDPVPDKPAESIPM